MLLGLKITTGRKNCLYILQKKNHSLRLDFCSSWQVYLNEFLKHRVDLKKNLYKKTDFNYAIFIDFTLFLKRNLHTK